MTVSFLQYTQRLLAAVFVLAVALAGTGCALADSSIFTSEARLVVPGENAPAAAQAAPAALPAQAAPSTPDAATGTATSTAPAAMPPVTSGGDGYRLGVGDKLGIVVLGEEDLSLQVLVNDQGAINYPFLGELKVAGLTIAQLRQQITTGLQPEYLLNPKVTVQVLEYRHFFVNGEVQKPGGFPWQPGMTVRKAASLAGGFSPRASRSRLFIIRDADPNRMPVQVDVDAPVAPGDIITIDQSFF